MPMLTKDQLMRVMLNQHLVPDETGMPRRIDDKWMETKQVVVISGVRRCGKSYLLRQIRKRCPERDYYLRFDDDRLINFTIDDFETLDACFAEVYGLQHTYFFDEIQNVEGWELYVRRLYNQGAKVFITGSNAKMLSREMGTHLSGIHLPIELYPFSFAEYLQLREIQVDKTDFYTTQGTARLVRELKSYMQTGGFPAYLLGEPDEYISSLYQSIIYKDVLMRNNISNGREVLELMHFLASNVAKRHSYMSLARVVGVKHSDTIKNYIQCLEETYLLSQLMKYSPSVKSQEGSIKKMYLIDNAIVKVIGFNPTENIGPLLENMVFIELKRRGREVFYHDGTKECDFIVREGIHIVQCIQVTVSLADERTRKREVDGLLDAARTYGTTDNLIITLDDDGIQLDNENVKVIPAWKFLLEDYGDCC